MGKCFSCSFTKLSEAVEKVEEKLEEFGIIETDKIKEYIRTEIKPIPDDTDINNYLEEGDINLNEIAEDEILCPKKCEEVPEILYFHSDNKTIELKCKKCGLDEKKITDFYNSIRDSGKNYLKSTCHLCKKIQKKIKILVFFIVMIVNLIFAKNAMKIIKNIKKPKMKENIKKMKRLT